MIQANCRDRFTGADFDFVVKTLSKSRRDAVSLPELLTDADTRDTILDYLELRFSPVTAAAWDSVGSRPVNPLPEAQTPGESRSTAPRAP